MRALLYGFVLLHSALPHCYAQNDLESFLEHLKPVYMADTFAEDHPNPEWAPHLFYKPPAGRLLLGKFLSEETASLELKKLPPHRCLLIRLEIVVLCHWDGIWERFGPDKWEASLLGGPTLLSTTFSNFQQARQNFPDETGSAVHPYLSGSTSSGDYEFVKEMGDKGKRWDKLDTTYHIWLVAEHSANTATLRFSGNFHDAPDGPTDVGESWAIAGCHVWAIPPDKYPHQDALKSALASLTDTAAVPCTRMIASLVLAGEIGFPEIEKHLRAHNYEDLLPPSPLRTGPARLADFIEKLADEDFKTREIASKKLFILIPRHREELMAMRDKHPEPEVRIRIRQALAQHGAPREGPDLVADTDKQIVAARLRHALRLMTSEKASGWLSSLH